jgi:hypothetical protein
MALATTSELIRSALRNYRTQTGVSGSTAASYAARLRVVLGEQRHRIRPGSRSATRRASHPTAARVLAAIRQREDIGVSATRTRSRLHLPNAPPDAAREGEGAIDWVPAQFWTRSPAHARRAQWRKQHATMSRLAFQHDSRTAQLADYASAHSRLFSRAPRAITGDQRISTLIEGLAVVYGMTPSTLTTLTQGSGPRDDSDLVIDFREGRLWIRLPRVGYNNDTLSQACAEASRSGSDWASVPLVPYLRDVARLLHTQQEPAIMRSFAEVTRKIERRRLARLARSLPGWLTRCGLPGVLASLLTGDFDYTPYLATSAYINVSEQHVRMAHVSAFRCFEAQIAAECRRRAWTFASVLGPGMAPSLSGNRHFGSRIVPLTGRLQQAIQALETRRREARLGGSLTALARAWNLTAVYTWFRLSWAAALRPCRDPVVRRGDVEPETGWIFVRDKDSPFSRESRLVPLALRDAQLLERFAHDGDRVRVRLRAMTRTAMDQLADDAVFFLVVDGRARSLSAQLVRLVLQQEGLGDLFPWPLNAPRHYWLTRALELEMPIDQIEPFIGHSHEPLPWGSLSLVSLKRLSETMRRLGTILLREAGFRAE